MWIKLLDLVFVVFAPTKHMCSGVSMTFIFEEGRREGHGRGKTRV